MENTLYKIVIGIRHSRQFRFIDKAGHMVDDILVMNKTSNFNSKELFTEIGWASDRSSFVLQSRNKDIVLECNTDGIVLTCNLDGELELTLLQIKNIFLKCVDKVINKTDGGKTLNRIGIVHYYSFYPESDAAKYIADHYLNMKNLGDPSEVAVKLVVKNPIPIIVGTEKRFDYRNAIFQMSNSVATDESDEKAAFKLSLDFQMCYSPDKNYEGSLVEEHYNYFTEYIETMRTGGLSKIFSTVEQKHD